MTRLPRFLRLPAPDPDVPPALWRSLHYFNLYRLTISGVFVASFVLFGPTLTYGAYDPRLFFLVSIGYVLFSALASLPNALQWPRFEWQLSAHVLGDVAFITTLSYASGGIRSGLGLLLVVSVAASGLVGRGRLVVFFAAVASLAILGEQSYRVAELGEESWGFVQGGLLSFGYFAVAVLAFSLARRMRLSEQEARERTVDLENLAQVNQLVLQDMDDGVLVADGVGRLRQHNAKAAYLLGRALSATRQQALWECSPALAESFTRWREKEGESVVLVRAEGSGKSLRVRFAPVGSRRELGAVLFLEDMERLQAQAQQYKLAALGRLTASIAHEIRNPLSAISYADELLLEEEGLPAGQVRLLEIIRDNTRRLEKMVQEVLQLNRRDRANPELLLLATYVAEFLEEFCQIEKLEPALFRVEVPEGLRVSFDRAHLHQILWNLCRNAVRHGSKGAGSVRLIARAEGRGVELTVADDGPGVDEALRGQLFEPFFTTSAQGTGLGLYVAREIAEANGAALELLPGSAPGAVFRLMCKGEDA